MWAADESATHASWCARAKHNRITERIYVGGGGGGGSAVTVSSSRVTKTRQEKSKKKKGHRETEADGARLLRANGSRVSESLKLRRLRAAKVRGVVGRGRGGQT